MTHNDTNETFVRTSPPLNRFTVKLGGPAPWEILTADYAQQLAADLRGAMNNDILGISWLTDVRVLDAYADAVHAMTPGYPERDMVTTVEDLGY